MNWLHINAVRIWRQNSTSVPLDDWAELEGQDPFHKSVQDRLVEALRCLQASDEAMEWHGVPLFEVVCRELVRGGQTDKAKDLLSESERTTESREALAWLMARAARNNDVDAGLRLLAKLSTVDFAPVAAKPTTSGAAGLTDPANLAWWLSRLMILHRKNLSDELILSDDNLRILDAAFTAYSQPNFGRSTSRARIAILSTMPPRGGFEKQLQVVQKIVPYDRGWSGRRQHSPDIWRRVFLLPKPCLISA